MLEKAFQIAKDVFALNERVTRLETIVDGQTTELKELARTTQALVFELQRQRDAMEQQRRNAEQERREAAKDRAILMLRLENALLKAGINPPMDAEGGTLEIA